MESDNSSTENRSLLDFFHHQSLDNFDRREISKACFRIDETEDVVNERAKLDATLRRGATVSFELGSHADGGREDGIGFC